MKSNLPSNAWERECHCKKNSVLSVFQFQKALNATDMEVTYLCVIHLQRRSADNE